MGVLDVPRVRPVTTGITTMLRRRRHRMVIDGGDSHDERRRTARIDCPRVRVDLHIAPARDGNEDSVQVKES